MQSADNTHMIDLFLRKCVNRKSLIPIALKADLSHVDYNNILIHKYAFISRRMTVYWRYSAN